MGAVGWIASTVLADQWLELDMRNVYIGKNNSNLKQNTC